MNSLVRLISTAVEQHRGNLYHTQSRLRTHLAIIKKQGRYKFPHVFQHKPHVHQQCVHAHLTWTSTMFASLGSGTRPDLTPQPLPPLSEPSPSRNRWGWNLTFTVLCVAQQSTINTTVQSTSCPCTQTLHVRISILPASPNDTYLQRHGCFAACSFCCFLSFPLSLSFQLCSAVGACLLCYSFSFSSFLITINISQPRPTEWPSC